MPTAHKKNRAPLREPLSMCFTLYLPAWHMTGVSAASVFFFGSGSVHHYFVRCPAHVPMPGSLIRCYSSLCVPVYHSDMVLYACIFLYSRKIMAAFVGSWPSSFYPLSFLLLYSYMPVVPSIVFMFTVYDECPPQELSRSSLWWTLLIISYAAMSAMTL